MTPLIKELILFEPEVALSSIWFDVGAMPNYATAWDFLMEPRLPFDKCAICGIDWYGKKFLISASQSKRKSLQHIPNFNLPPENSYGDEQIITGLVSWQETAGGYIKTPLFLMMFDKQGCGIASVEGQKEITKEIAAPIIAIVKEFILSANPTGYRAEPRKNSITNKRRASKGRSPLIYDWHTVLIEPPEAKSDSCGGTHAGPRLHDRRGHWRTCPSGKRTWVRSCKVGDASRGTIFKDYQISRPEDEL